MVKADMTRDYYADLELQPTADTAEIKKQFKKLALKWHPDRNPGRESEVNAKFQTIQSAHEILSDEVERRKYDAGRLRSSRTYNTSYGTRGNPWSSAGSQWPTPPPPPGSARAKAEGKGSSAGANKYKQWNAPPTSRQDDHEAKKNNYAGWNNMRNTHTPRRPEGSFARGAAESESAYAKWQKPNPAPPKQNPVPPPRTSKPNPTEGFSRQNSTRKSGYMPRDADGDEPAAPSAFSAYSNSRSRHASAARNPTPPRPPPRDNVPEWSRDPDVTVDNVDARQSTPYATHGGEKTNPFETSHIHRSNTTRERPASQGYGWDESKKFSTTPGGPREKPRSTSPPRSRKVREEPSPFDANVGSPPKRTHSHINASPPTAVAGNKARVAPRSNARSRATSDTSSEDVDLDVPQATTNPRPSQRLPRRKIQPSKKEAGATPKSNVNGDQNGSSGANQPMYAQGFPRSISDNFSATTDFEREKSRPFSELDPLLENLRDKLRVNSVQGASVPAHTPSTPRRRSATLRNSYSSEHDPRHSNNASNSSSQMSGADDLSRFEQNIMGSLRTTFAKTSIEAELGSPTPVRGSGRDMNHAAHFKQSTAAGSSKSHASSAMPPPPTPSSNVASRVASSGNKSPKRKAGVYDSGAEQYPHYPRKIEDFYTGLAKSNVNMTNNHHRFSSTAYRNHPPAVPYPIFTAQHANSINTTFETGQWDGQFRADSFVNPTEFASPSRSQAANRSGRRSPIKTRSNGRARSASASVHSDSQPPAPGQPQATASPTEIPAPKPFAAEDWSAPELFQPSTFAPPATPRGPTKPPPFSRTPSRKSTRSKSSNTSKTAGGKAAIVEDYSSDSDVAQNGSGVGMNGNASSANAIPPSPNAMDIDSPYDGNGDSKEARTVPTAPIRPEWRASATNGHAHATKNDVDDDDDFKTNFDDLKNVEPLFQPAQGLNSVSDLKSSLPFQSSASNTVPIQSEAHHSTNLKIPNPPLAPKVPSKKTSWSSYLGDFQRYWIDYQLYDEQIEAHFRARRDAKNHLRDRVGWSWMESRSDDMFDAQMAEVRQDRLVKEKWAEAAKGHEVAMSDFQKVRAVMLGKQVEGFTMQ